MAISAAGIRDGCRSGSAEASESDRSVDGRLSVGKEGAALPLLCSAFSTAEAPTSGCIGGEAGRMSNEGRVADSGISASGCSVAGGDLDGGERMGEPFVISLSAEKRETGRGLPNESRLKRSGCGTGLGGGGPTARGGRSVAEGPSGVEVVAVEKDGEAAGTGLSDN